MMRRMDRLDELERIARGLEPGTADRDRLRAAATEYAERFLDALPELPGYVEDDDRAVTALPTPVVTDGPEDPSVILSTLWEAVDRVGVNESAGHFFGFIPGASLHSSAVADYLAAVTNRYAGVAFGAPGAVRLQQRLLEWLAGVFGYPADAGGDLTSGGSIANLIAIVTARDAIGARPAELESLVVYLTEQAHHSIDKALRIAGVGSAVQRRIPLDGRFRMRVDALVDQIGQDRAAGLRPWLVVAAAGTTDAGAVDPLAEIGPVAAENGVWFHVDAAYGGGFALCRPGQDRLRGIEGSDSMVMDPHKALFIPFGTGIVLVKDRDAMIRAHAYDATYMQDALSGGAISPADVSPELTRPNRVLRVWLPLRLHGLAPFRAALEEKLLLARELHRGLGGISQVEVGPEPDLSVVVFRCRGRDGDHDGATRRLHEALLADGRMYLSSTVLNGDYTLRMAVVNARTHREHVDRALAAIGELAELCA